MVRCQVCLPQGYRGFLAYFWQGQTSTLLHMDAMIKILDPELI